MRYYGNIYIILKYKSLQIIMVIIWFSLNRNLHITFASERNQRSNSIFAEIQKWIEIIIQAHF